MSTVLKHEGLHVNTHLNPVRRRCIKDLCFLIMIHCQLYPSDIQRKAAVETQILNSFVGILLCKVNAC